MAGNPTTFPFIRLDEFVIMPNHIHGILWIDKSINADDDAVGRTADDDVVGCTADGDVVGCMADGDAVGCMADGDVVGCTADGDVVGCTADGDVVGCRDAINRVSTETQTQPKTENKKIGGITGKHNPMNQNNISRVIRWYKGRCTFETNKIYGKSYFAWQPRFHDRIIRDENELNRIREYIINNPQMWEQNRNNQRLWTKNNLL